jgi:hypothetical protein
MRIFKHFIFALLLIHVSDNAISQNIMINVLTQNTGVVEKNGLIFFEVTISNTSPTKAVPIYKLRPQISFPTALVSIPEAGHVLPKGWSLTSNDKGIVWLSNGTDIIPGNGTRTILIAMKGKELGGPSTISGNLTFSNGIAPGSVVGSATIGDNIADNISTSSITVRK